MKVHEQRDVLAEAIKLALPYLGSGPPLGAFGIAREDCALAHMDYFGSVHSAAGVLMDALGSIEGIDGAEAWKRYGREVTPCDCRSCVGERAAAASRAKHRAAYTNVRAWRVKA
jgi:hypothetical protein